MDVVTPAIWPSLCPLPFFGTPEGEGGGGVAGAPPLDSCAPGALCFDVFHLTCKNASVPQHECLGREGGWDGHNEQSTGSPESQHNSAHEPFEAYHALNKHQMPLNSIAKAMPQMTTLFHFTNAMPQMTTSDPTNATRRSPKP